jgi:outer membrane protein TolC
MFFVEIPVMLCRLLYVFFLCFFSGAVFAGSSGDRILQEREVRMNALSDKLHPLQEKKSGSALADIENIDGSIELVNESAVRSFSLQEAIKQTLKNNVRLKNQQLNVQNSRINKRLAPRIQKFNLDVQSGVNWAGVIEGDSRDRYHRQLSNLDHKEDAYHLGMRFYYTLLDGGISKGLYEQASLQEQLTILEQEKIRQDLMVKTVKGYVELILLQEELTIAGYELELARNILAEKERNPTFDPRMAMEVLDSKLKLELAHSREAEVRNALKTQKDKFRILLGLPEDEDFVPEKNARTRSLEESVDGLILHAMSHSIKIKTADLRRRIAEAERLAISGEQNPDLQLFGKTGYVRLLDRDKADEIRYVAGVEVNWNLFNGGDHRNTMSRNRNEIQILRNEEEALKEEVAASVRACFYRFFEAQNRLPTGVANVRFAQQLLFEAEERFQKKQLSRENLLSARIEYRKSVRQYYYSLGEMIRAKIELLAETGQLNESVFG